MGAKVGVGDGRGVGVGVGSGDGRDEGLVDGTVVGGKDGRWEGLDVGWRVLRTVSMLLVSRTAPGTSAATSFWNSTLIVITSKIQTS